MCIEGLESRVLIFMKLYALLRWITENKATKNWNQIYFHQDTEFLNNQ